MPEPRRPRRGAVAAVLALLLLAGWAPLLTLHVAGQQLDDGASGTLLVVFPPGTSAADAYARTVAARGTPLGRAGPLDSVWWAHSTRPGFVAALKRRGALAGFAPALLEPGALLCLGGGA